MKKSILILLLICAFSLNAQQIEGKLSLNGKSKTEIKLETNSAVQLFKEFKTGKYNLKFNYNSKEVPPNIYKESVVFFEFITVVKKDGELVKNIVRKQPIPYFPGDMDLPAEAFDFIGVLAFLDGKKAQTNYLEKGYQGTLPAGEYNVQLMIRPIGVKGEIAPVEFNFTLRKRPEGAKY